MIKTAKDKRFCVYLHLDAEGVIRYVGNGTLHRASTKHGRNSTWKDIFKDNPPEVVIVEENLTKEDAVSLEYYMYYSCKDTIVNRTPPTPVLHMEFHEFDEYFYICPTSHSGLRRKKTSSYARGVSVGDPAGNKVTYKNGKEYWIIKHQGKTYFVHRIIYLLNNRGIDPDLVINHIDGNGLNNSIKNLEQTTHSCNSFKKKPCKGSSVETGIRRKQLKSSIAFHCAIRTKEGKRLTVVFSSRKLGEEDALEAAKTWRSYYSYLHWGLDIPSGASIEYLKAKLQGFLARSKYSDSKAKPRKVNGKYVCEVAFGGSREHIQASTYEEAIAARDAFVADYNSKIEVNI